MQSTARLFHCARCRRQVLICRHCDRGNRYCGKRCSQAARRESVRAAGKRFQRSRRGRFAHAQRQHRYRQRRRQKVTHQGSPPGPADETLAAESRTLAKRTEVPAGVAGEDIRCQLCGRLCSAFVRQGFKHRRPAHEAIDLPPPVWAQRQGP